MTEVAAVRPRTTHTQALGQSEWSIWRTFLLRGAGIPAAWADELEERIWHPLVREAVLSQNPTTARLLLRDSTSRLRRRRETLAGYLQRYATKNDTIGCFGPVGWGTWVDGPTAVVAGPAVTRLRTVRFEQWAIDELGRALERRHGLRAWVAPTRAPSVAVRDGHVIIGAVPRRLGPLLDSVFGLVDGDRPARDLATELADVGATEEDVFDALETLQSLGAVVWDLGAAKRTTDPERRLRGRLLRVADPVRRTAALADLTRLEEARDRVAGTAGDPEALDAAFADLESTFESLTGTPAGRRPGELYAGRFPIYEDAVRDTSIELSEELLERLAPPLALLLTSARWLTCAVEQAHHDEALALHARLGGGEVPLALLTAELFGSISRAVGERVAPIAAELRRRWTVVLGPSVDEHLVTRRAEDLADAVAEAFPAAGPGWTAARYHSPDVLIAADGVDAIAAGVCRFVIGELHIGLNTIDMPAFVAQHERPGELLTAVEHDVPGRILPLLPRSESNSRTYPPTMLQSPRFTYVGFGTDPPDCPDGARILPLYGLAAVVVDGRLRVRGDDVDLPWSEVVGEFLSMTCANAFGILEHAPHTPRVAIDDVVVARESWRFPLDTTPLAQRAGTAERQAAVRTWVHAVGLPRRTFLLLPGAGKPQYLDVENDLSIDVAARFARRGLDHGPQGDLLVSEMLPGPDELWLPDAEGNRYTSELRLVCVDGRAA